MVTYHFFASTPKNMESLLADELRSLGGENVAETRAGASFSGTLATAYKICLWSRIANRVLLVLDRFPAPTPEALYDGVQSTPWDEHFTPAETIAVDFNTSNSQITHSHYGALKVKDAIVDLFRLHCGTRPWVDTNNPDIRINVYLLRDEATICLDLSGASLHKRGYREAGVAAPLKENLAAAILLRAGWPEIAANGGALVDPMCGSGTLPIEAALIAADIAPGLQHEHWGFLRWKKHHTNAWSSLIEDAQSRKQQGLKRLPSIQGFDYNPSAVRAATANVARAGLTEFITIEHREFEQATPAKPGESGLVVVNPPYGERLGADANLAELYFRLGRLLKDQFLGWHSSLITGNPELGKKLGLRAKRKHALYNGRIECTLLHFDIVPELFISNQQRPAPLPVAKHSEGAQMFANRFKKNLKHLSRWARREGIHCYRLYGADLPEYAIAVDLYEGEKRWVHVQEYEAPKNVDKQNARRRVREALSIILEVLELPEDQLFFKVRRQQKGTDQYEKLAANKHYYEVYEGGCRFLVNFEDYLDTGLFLDHRITRSKLAELVTGKHFLNLFGYTGAATIYAAKGGAKSTLTVDMSNTYLQWARRNLTLNGFDSGKHRTKQANCLEWLNQAPNQHKYGLIFLDPPSFSSSKRMDGTFDVQRDHVELIKKTIKLLEPGGVLIFSNNLRRFKMDAEALSELQIKNISRATLPKDFERNPRVHNCWSIAPTP
ncbi:23S rRNA (guanine(2445)-N(2))-methyltransferase / 23S rRNA (guanine(2069)-N(7))-methyltransferase [hydrothermal vent metagenome]|uniref:23S rRNA (Guanine(2445)-N(2))-methyltransferase / 23S rRNA (Guanine(2069)-N(7))-methyltransferase n=1 Tax=hydrothermal vent metagenome TaxID=652676 RepID=A0A3B1BE35_9ZZZZ